MRRQIAFFCGDFHQMNIELVIRGSEAALEDGKIGHYKIFSWGRINKDFLLKSYAEMDLLNG